MVWKPNVTVAAIVEQDGKFLLVEEKAGGMTVLNQPAGHLEHNESLLSAVARETLEETAWRFQPEYLIGVYRWQRSANPVTYIRFCFSGAVTDHDPQRSLDEGIIQAVWLTANEIEQEAARHRSPQVQKCLDDYLAGQRYPLDLITDL